MKIIIRYFFLVVVISIQAQEFKPYKIKSGTLIYEKIRYSTRAVFKFKNGVETGSREQIPYVAEQVNYYWDNYGDVSFEETYQVSKFGGELLPKKVKISEQLWVDEYRYYFNNEENKVSKDPYYLRIKCKENFQYYQIKDSWIETLHMGTEKSGTKEILDIKTDYYKIDKYQDLYTWKGLDFKNESFSTTRKGERLYPDRTQIAVKVDTITKINKNLFDPIWLKREKLYNSLIGEKIDELIDVRPDLLVQADNVKGIKIQQNDILLFITSKSEFGKMKILELSKENELVIQFQLYNLSNEASINRDSYTIQNNTLVNIDEANVEVDFNKMIDFKWLIKKKSNLFPMNNIGIYLLKASRAKTKKHAIEKLNKIL